MQVGIDSKRDSILNEFMLHLLAIISKLLKSPIKSFKLPKLDMKNQTFLQ